MPSKLHPFWYTPALPFFFFGSAVAVGLAMTIFESTQSAKAFGRQLELPVLVELGGALLVALWVNALLRFEDYFHRGMLRQIIKPSYEAYFLWLELALAFVIPITHAELQESQAVAQLSVSGLDLHCAGLHHQPTEHRSHRLRDLCRTSLHTEVDGVLGHSDDHRDGLRPLWSGGEVSADFPERENIAANSKSREVTQLPSAPVF